MFFDPQCIPCIINQAYESSKKFASGNTELQLKIVKNICAEVEAVDINYTAPMFSSSMQKIIEEYLDIKNPYKKLKDKNIIIAEKFIPYIKTLIDRSADKLEMAIRTAIIGNAIDLGANPNFDIEFEVSRITSGDIYFIGYQKFKEDLKKAELILYIADNYEEALFDKFLITALLPKNVVFVVRSKPILNDITMEDAKKLEIEKLCKVIESGSIIAGTDLNECTPEFLDLYRKADIVISKGQGNYETLLNEVRPIYFLFRVKCDVIASRCGLKKGDGAFFYNGVE